jgi:Na+/H+ antiporter NhaD/arsenite permease-like protein
MKTTALIIFIITYTGIIFTRLPKINIDRPSAAFFGAVAMMVFGVLSFDEAVQAIDFNTIFLLLGMMIIITTLQLDGFFSWIATRTIAWSKTQTRLLIMIVFATGISSAFLVNDAVVLLFTPVIIVICRSSSLNPVPYLIAEILASNIGSAMTITGNPQNMLIGMNSGIPYPVFLLKLMPVSLLGMLLIILVMRLIYPSVFKGRKPIQFSGNGFEYKYASMRFSVPIFAGVIVLFFFSHSLGMSIPLIALLGASLILIFGKIKPSQVVKNVDWVLLLFFACLFIVVEGAVKTGLFQPFVEHISLQEDGKGIFAVHSVSLLLSQVVSNVPFTIMMLPVFGKEAGDLLWLSLASASTLAGNATIIGAMANLIVIETAERDQVRIGFREFLKAGFITTLASLVISMLLFMLYASLIR